MLEVCVECSQGRNSLLGYLCNVPLAVNDLVVGGNIIADQRQDHHHHMLCHTDHIGACTHSTSHMPVVYNSDTALYASACGAVEIAEDNAGTPGRCIRLQNPFAAKLSSLTAALPSLHGVKPAIPFTHWKDCSPVTSATVMPAFEAASRSTWSLPMPAVSASFSFFALAMRSGVR